VYTETRSRENEMAKKDKAAEAAEEIRANLGSRPETPGNLQSALTKMWENHDYDTPLMEAAYEVYRNGK
jgi:hypothetical protein